MTSGLHTAGLKYGKEKISMKKRFLAVFLALALCVGLAPTVFAAGTTSGECGEYAIWSFDQSTGTLTISGTGSMDIFWEASSVVSNPSAIRNVVINEGITFISECAFLDCTNVINVTIPQSVTSVGADAFTGTLWLKSLGVFAIANGMLLKYQGYQANVVIPNGVTSIAPSAFYGNETITSVVIPEGFISMGIGGLSGDVFSGCTNLESITFPGTLKAIGRFCFEDTKWLANQKGDFVMAGSILVKYQGKNPDVVIPDGVTALADGSLQDVMYDGDEPIIPTSLTVPVSMKNLNFDMAFFMAPPDYLPKTILYKGTQEQWNKVEGVKDSSLTDPEISISVHCTGTTDPAPTDPTKVFTDLSPTGFYLDAVAWAVDKNITTGTTATTFSPKDNCTHGQILTFLWRAAGSPESNVTTPFAMNGNEYYYGAAKWAYEKGMIDKNFNHKTPCTRADAVNYIWQAFGKPSASYDGRFTDVSASSPYATAVAWALANGVTTGATETTFNPSGICNRGQIVTFLHRAYNK